MKFSAVVLDLDGTLLNTEKNISKRNLSCYRHGMKDIIFPLTLGGE